MAGEVLNMNVFTTNKHQCKLKDLCFKNRHKTIYEPLCAILKKPMISFLDETGRTHNLKDSTLIVFLDETGDENLKNPA